MKGNLSLCLYGIPSKHAENKEIKLLIFTDIHTTYTHIRPILHSGCHHYTYHAGNTNLFTLRMTAKGRYRA